MFQVCIMAGHEGRLRSEKKIHLTLMGGMGLIRPTVARQLLARRQQQGAGQSKPQRQFFLTIMGGVEIKSPTLAEEFIDLRELLASGALNMDEWEHGMVELGRSDTLIASFTLMGGFEECSLPTENQEVDSLALQRHLGNISEGAGQVLQLGFGQRDAERRSTLRRAILAES